MTAVKTAMWAVPIANMIGVMIRDYCWRVGVEIAEPSTPTPSAPTASQSQPFFQSDT